MKKIMQKMIGMVLILIGILAALYIGLSVYYQGSFSYGTWVNAVYCTGKSVTQCNTELLTADTYDRLTLLLPDGSKEELYLCKIGYQADFTKPLQEIKKAQNSWNWYQNLSAAARRRQIMPEARLDEEKLEAALSQLDFIKEAMKPASDHKVYIQKTEKGYVLINERSQVPDYEACRERIKEAILDRKEELDLLKAGCYTSLPLNAKAQETLRLWEKLEAFCDCEILYHFGEQEERIDAAVVCDWLIPAEDTIQTEVVNSMDAFAVDEKGELLADQKKLEAYVDELADRYDTVGKTRQFQTTRGDVVEVGGGTYGNLIDREAEKEYLYQAFMEKRHEEREPIYLQEAARKGTQDIGDTYIEVDMKTQQLYYYREGALVLESQIVTGDMRRRRQTPSMVCYIYNKQKNRVLRGPGYASPVKYWMPVKGGIGIHDARWRKSFGGDIYLTNGSHGCINMPLEKAEQLFNEAEIGTPVVMFYE